MWNSLRTICKKLILTSRLVKLEHTLFSAPFLCSSLLIATGSKSFLPELRVLFFAGLALLGARSAAMSLNRLIDRKIDALNPRTKDRELPQKKLSTKFVLFFAFCSFVLLFWSAFNLPRLCFYLSPVAVFWLVFYSYTKRFTYLSHYVLGLTFAASVAGGWIAVTGQITLFAVLLTLAVSFWVAGFDIVYALQDLQFDRRNRLYSIPACFGLKKALQIAQLSHLVAAIFFVLPIFLAPEEIRGVFWFYCLGCLSVIFGLVKQHLGIIRNIFRLKKVIDLYFFEFNAWISFLFFLLILLGKLVSTRF